MWTLKSKRRQKSFVNIFNFLEQILKFSNIHDFRNLVIVIDNNIGLIHLQLLFGDGNFSILLSRAEVYKFAPH